MMKFLKEYIAEMDKKIENSTSQNSADTKAKIKTRDDMQQKLSTLVGEIKTESGLQLSIEKFDFFLRWRAFLVLTDHKALCSLDKKVLANDKLSRWQERLHKYNFCVEYIRGAENTLADMLSRPWDKTKKNYDKKITDELAGAFYHQKKTSGF